MFNVTGGLHLHTVSTSLDRERWTVVTVVLDVLTGPGVELGVRGVWLDGGGRLGDACHDAHTGKRRKIVEVVTDDLSLPFPPPTNEELSAQDRVLANAASWHGQLAALYGADLVLTVLEPERSCLASGCDWAGSEGQAATGLADAFFRT